MNDSDIVIIGGGIGGLCAAIALRHRGIDARVYESVAEVRAVGAGIILAPNGMRALATLGLADAAQAQGMPLDRLLLTDAQRRPLLVPSDRAALVREFGYGLTAIHRADLYRLLIDQLPADAVLGGKTLTRFTDDGADVTAAFADGTQAHGRLLIGAEGIHSVVRSQLFPSIAPRYSGQTSYRGMAEFALKSAGFSACEAWGDQIRIGLVAVSATQTYWYSTELAAAGGRDVSKAEAIASLRKRARDFAPPFADVLAATSDARLIRTDMFDLPPLPAWHRGRVALLGDAAHATTPNLGQGGNQALVDAVALADALAANADHTAAFEAYQRARKLQAERVVSRSRQLGDMVHLRSGWMRRLRNAVLRKIPASVGARQNREIFGA